ncbi:DUF7838 family putative zinc beta-ribbon protein [Halorhabdus tiamatea]
MGASLAGVQTLTTLPGLYYTMSDTAERYCPNCRETREFVRTARTRMNLGTKVKWRCPECGFRIVNIENAVDTGVSA